MSIKLVVGLGNPGKEYEHTRHNLGFDLLDMLAEDLSIKSFKSDFNGQYAKADINGNTFYLLKPMTYMNLSGNCVLPFIKYFKIKPEEIIVLLDDMDLEPGRFRMREKGSSGGQKGLGNIINLLGTDEIKRIRIGSGKPADKNVIDYVLTKPTQEEQKRIDEALEQALLALKYAIAIQDFQRATSKFNTNKVL